MLYMGVKLLELHHTIDVVVNKRWIKMKKIMVMVCAILMGTVIISGCLRSDDDVREWNLTRALSIGDTWTYNTEDEDGVTGTITMTVISTSETFKGREVVMIEGDINMDDHTIDNITRKSITGTSVIYIDGRTNYVVYYNESISGMRSIIGEIYTPFSIETERTYTYACDRDNKVSVEDSWSVTRTVVTKTETYLADIRIEHREFTETSTRRYEAVEELKYSVEAGTFEVLKIIWEDMDGDDHGIIYHTDRVKMPVYTIEYIDDLESASELRSYSI